MFFVLGQCFVFVLDVCRLFNKYQIFIVYVGGRLLDLGGFGIVYFKDLIGFLIKLVYFVIEQGIRKLYVQVEFVVLVFIGGRVIN